MDLDAYCSNTPQWNIQPYAGFKMNLNLMTSSQTAPMGEHFTTISNDGMYTWLLSQNLVVSSQKPEAQILNRDKA